jgi:isopentenyl diphosphate isomerase/L-lactate dehydrogenase-like FMN-dependent dehydrogenase
LIHANVHLLFFLHAVKSALGANAVGIGKPIFFALGIGGEEAVSYMLELLQTELEAAMAICGMERIADITPNMVTRHPSGSHPTMTILHLRSSL